MDLGEGAVLTRKGISLLGQHRGTHTLSGTEIAKSTPYPFQHMHTPSNGSAPPQVWISEQSCISLPTCPFCDNLSMGNFTPNIWTGPVILNLLFVLHFQLIYEILSQLPWKTSCAYSNDSFFNQFLRLLITLGHYEQVWWYYHDYDTKEWYFLSWLFAHPLTLNTGALIGCADILLGRVCPLCNFNTTVGK